MVTQKKKKGTKKAPKKSKEKRPTKKGKKKQAKRRRPKTVKKAKPSAQEVPKAQVIGVVTHYFPHVQAAVVKLKKPLAVGDAILIKGSTTHFQQQVESMQIDRMPIQKAKKGDEIGLQVNERVREHDLVLVPS